MARQIAVAAHDREAEGATGTGAGQAGGRRVVRRVSLSPDRAACRISLLCPEPASRVSLFAPGGKTEYHQGILGALGRHRGRIRATFWRKSILSYANTHRPWQFFETIFYRTLAQVQKHLLFPFSDFFNGCFQEFGKSGVLLKFFSVF